MLTLNPALRRLQTYPAEALKGKKRALLAAGRPVFDFSVGDPIEPTDARIVHAFHDAVPAISQYPSITGEAAFRQACARWVSRRFGVSLDPDSQILPSSGSKEAIFHVAPTFLDPRGTRRRVLFGTPAYPVYGRSALLCGGEPWPVELQLEDGYRLQPWQLPASGLDETAVLWLNYPHNPTAATVDADYLRRVADLCRKHEILLCSDECYVDLYFGEQPPPSLLQVASEGILTFHSLSKRSGMTGYRSGFIAGDAALIAQLRHARANFGVAPSLMVQHASTVAWDDDDHVTQRRGIFRAKRDLLTAFFTQAGISYAPCEATLYLWVRTPGDTDPLRYAEELADHGILVSPAPYLGVDQPFVRVALVPSVEACREAITVWQQLWERETS